NASQGAVSGTSVASDLGRMRRLSVALPLLLACDPAPPPVREGESQSAVSMEAVAINLCQTTIWCGFVTSNDLTSCDRTSVPEACADWCLAQYINQTGCDQTYKVSGN